MQTFLTSTSLRHTAAVLDDKRLNKQLVEARQLYDILTNAPTCRATTAQRNHPIVTTWRDYPQSDWPRVLPAYIVALRIEYLQRTGKAHASAKDIDNPYLDEHYFPAAFCTAHRYALRAKLPEHYNKETKLGPSPFNQFFINYLWYNSKLGWYTGSLSKHNVNIIAQPGECLTVPAWVVDCINRGLLL